MSTKNRLTGWTARTLEPEAEIVDFDGARLILTGGIASYYRFFRLNGPEWERRALEDLRPALLERKRRMTERRKADELQSPACQRK